MICLKLIFVEYSVLICETVAIFPAIRRHFGKQVNKETKLRIHNITAQYYS